MEKVIEQTDKSRQTELERQNMWISSYRFELKEKTELLDNLIDMQRRLKDKINIDDNAYEDYCTTAKALTFMRDSLSIERHSKFGLEVASAIANDNVCDLNGLHEIEVMDRKKEELYYKINHVIDRLGNVI